MKIIHPVLKLPVPIVLPLTVLLVLIFYISIQNLWITPPVEAEVKKMFSYDEDREFIKYEIAGDNPVVKFRIRNAQICTVPLVPDYKLGFYTDNWIFSTGWSCNSVNK